MKKKESYDLRVKVAKKKDPWRWMILFSAAVMHVAVAFPVLQFSLIYHEFLHEENVSSTITSWIYNIFQIMTNVANVIAAPAFLVLGYRKVMLAAGFMNAFSFILSYFFLSVPTLFFTFSIMAGLANGLIFSMGMILPPLYFEKKAGMSIGIVNAGYCLGHIFGPFYLDLMKDTFRKYFLLMFGTVMLNGCSFAMAIVDPKKSTKTTKKKKITPELSYISNSKLDMSLEFKLENDKQIEKKNNIMCYPVNKLLKTFEVTGDVFKEILFSIKTAKSFTLTVIAMCFALALSCQVNFILYLPLFLHNNPLVEEDLLIWSLSCLAVAHFVSRSLVPTISDVLPFSKKWIALFGSVLMGSTVLLFPMFIYSKYTSLVLITLFGMSIGCTTPFRSLVIIEFMGTENLSRVYSYASLVIGVMFLASGPVIGWIRDYTNSYVIGIQCISSLGFIAALLWIILPLAQKLDEKLLREK